MIRANLPSYALQPRNGTAVEAHCGRADHWSEMEWEIDVDDSGQGPGDAWLADVGVQEVVNLGSRMHGAGNVRTLFLLPYCCRAALTRLGIPISGLATTKRI
jgi:hypothetical protein